ncbi:MULTISPECIES: C45 family peptidase [unclassified Virgibacillus]|uniref:C45 family autoproteolytic acyltransferase/hydolase n=1 Tax=unclassified Virgibacillus TaxID=2620237 RepID=UPI0024DE45F3|nr:C45 family peptidase [Virgibacillus sp. LDC-1]
MIHNKLLELDGSYYEIGKKIGEEAGKSLHFQQVLALIKQYNFQQDSHEIREKLTEWCPQLLDEIAGISDGLKISNESGLRLFAGYDMPKLEGMGCTSFCTQDYYVRNYDFSPQLFDNIFMVQHPVDGRMLCGHSQLLLGRLDGMNENGLIIGLHFVNNNTYKKGFLCSTITRIVLETCTTTEEAIELLGKLPHAASYNYSLLDRHGSMAIVEAAPSIQYVHRNTNYLIGTNMFYAQDLQPYNRANHDSSQKRVEAIKNWEYIPSAEEVHEWFANTDSPVFYKDYDAFFGTLYTITYLPKVAQVIRTNMTGETKSFTL